MLNFGNALSYQLMNNLIEQLFKKNNQQGVSKLKTYFLKYLRKIKIKYEKTGLLSLINNHFQQN